MQSVYLSVAVIATASRIFPVEMDTGRYQK